MKIGQSIRVWILFECCANAEVVFGVYTDSDQMERDKQSRENQNLGYRYWSQTVETEPHRLVCDSSEETEADAEQAIYHDIWKEILRGDHDTSDGHAPDSVGLDIDGNWFVSYPPIVDGGIRWENTVRSI